MFATRIARKTALAFAALTFAALTFAPTVALAQDAKPACCKATCCCANAAQSSGHLTSLLSDIARRGDFWTWDSVLSPKHPVRASEVAKRLSADKGVKSNCCATGSCCGGCKAS